MTVYGGCVGRGRDRVLRIDPDAVFRDGAEGAGSHDR
jgi:hypothetical protein